MVKSFLMGFSARFSLQQKFLLCIILIIVPVLGIIFSWVEIQIINQTKEQKEA